MEEFLLTTAEIAAAFAGFASVVVIFRRDRSVQTDESTKVTFQSMLLGSLFTIFFSLLPLALHHLLESFDHAFLISSCLLLIYIIATFAWGIRRSGGGSALPYAFVALTIAGSQVLGLLGVLPLPQAFVVGVFALLTVSGYAFYSLITFAEPTQSD